MSCIWIHNTCTGHWSTPVYPGAESGWAAAALLLLPQQSKCWSQRPRGGAGRLQWCQRQAGPATQGKNHLLCLPVSC